MILNCVILEWKLAFDQQNENKENGCFNALFFNYELLAIFVSTIELSI